MNKSQFNKLLKIAIKHRACRERTDILQRDGIKALRITDLLWALYNGLIADIPDCELTLKDGVFRKTGLQTYFKDSCGYEWHKRYNKAGLQTYYKDSCGYEEHSRYNKAGLKTYFKNSSGYEWHSRYNKAGLMTYFKKSSGYEWRR